MFVKNTYSLSFNFYILPDISALPLTKIEKKIVEDYKDCTLTLTLSHKEREEEISDYEIYKTFEGVNLESILMFGVNNTELVQHYLDNLRQIKIDITGNDLQALGIPPSSKYSEIFDYVLKEKLKNPALTKAQEIEIVKSFRIIT